MTSPRFVLVTGNPKKLEEARRLCGDRLGELAHVALDLPEPQSLDLLEVLQAKGDEAWRRLQVPLVVEETGLELPALNGFPGPLVKWMLQAVGAEGIARTALALGDPRATARCVLLYRDAERVVIAEGADSGTLVLPGRGSGGLSKPDPPWPDHPWPILLGPILDGQVRKSPSCDNIPPNLRI